MVDGREKGGEVLKNMRCKDRRERSDVIWSEEVI